MFIPQAERLGLLCISLCGVHAIPAPMKQTRFKNRYIDPFHPIWNISFMGSGIAASILYEFAYPAHWLRVCGLIMWAISLSLFILVNFFFIGKLIISGKKWPILSDPKLSVFLGAYSLGWSTIVNMTHYVSKSNFVIGTFVFWWINVAMALFCGWLVVFLLFAKSEIKPSELNPTLILPVLPLTVCAASGALIADSLPPHLELLTIVISYLLWSNSLCVGFLFIGIFFWNFLTSTVPAKPAAFTIFVPMGLLGQGAWGILNQGLNTKKYIINQTSLSNDMGNVFHYLSLPPALFLLGFAFFWSFLSVSTCIMRGKQPFNKGWWAMTFPIGTVSLASKAVYVSFGWETFRVISAIYGIVCVFTVVVCLIGSLLYEVPF